MDLGQLSLRQRESALLAGGTQVGKSTLADHLGEDFLARYYRLGARRLISDTKPRYRAMWFANGMPAGRLYRKWDHGPGVPDSVVAETPEEMRQAFKLGYRTVIVQSKGWRLKHDLIIDAFIEDSRRGRPQLLQVDETADHFHANGIPKGPEGALVVASRAGAERGTAALFCSQRTKGISAHLMEHMKRLYAFQLDVAADKKRFQEFGAPDFALPEADYLFKYWTKANRRKVYGPYKLRLPAGGRR